MLVAPLLIGVLRDRAVGLVVILLPTACSVWFLPSDMTGDFFIGFYPDLFTEIFDEAAEQGVIRRV